MTPKLSFQNTIPRRALATAILSFLLMLGVATPLPLLADEPYLKPGHPDGVALLPPPPAPGSKEQEADLNEARAVFKGRTPQEEARAFKDAKLSFSLFEPAIGPVFQPSKLPKTEALLKKIRSEFGVVIDHAKDNYKRQRPYVVDPQLYLGAPEKSFSYPSGHSTWGTIYSLVLAEIFPEKKDGILEMGRTIGWDRVIIGKHFPTDVFAGRVLGKAIFNELMESPSLQRDIAAAKAEAQAAAKP